MIIDLKPLFSGRQDYIALNCSVDLSGEEFGGVVPFTLPVLVTGGISVDGSVVTLDASAAGMRRGMCDRCLAELETAYSVAFRRILCDACPTEAAIPGAELSSLSDSDDDYVTPVPGLQLDLSVLVTEELLLAMPTKSLCRPNCRGLCLYCGKDLNDGLCGCRENLIDPRLSALKSLLEQD